ncbi:MAG TPA: hypothetical protein PKY96_13180 [Flavobacteriales bacterium]|nr:hypothetical protein [Flavobacteriales bacterium]
MLRRLDRGLAWRCLSAVVILGGTVQVRAQAPPQANKPETNPKAAATDSRAKTMDTGESLGFMGKSLWFEVRRRLNLTTEEEENKHKAEARQVKLKVGSFQVSREAASDPETAPDARR